MWTIISRSLFRFNDELSSSDQADANAALDVTPEEAEKQWKREQLVRKALRHALLKSGPIRLEELPRVLEEHSKVGKDKFHSRLGSWGVSVCVSAPRERLCFRISCSQERWGDEER